MPPRGRFGLSKQRKIQSRDSRPKKSSASRKRPSSAPSTKASNSSRRGTRNPSARHRDRPGGGGGSNDDDDDEFIDDDDYEYDDDDDDDSCDWENDWSSDGKSGRRSPTKAAVITIDSEDGPSSRNPGKPKKKSIFDVDLDQDQNRSRSHSRSRNDTHSAQKPHKNPTATRKRKRATGERTAKRARPPAGAYTEDVLSSSNRSRDGDDRSEQGGRDDRGRRKGPSGSRAKTSAPSQPSNLNVLLTQDEWAQALTAKIIGQKIAVHQISVLLERAPIQMIISPVVMLMSGPSGTGKSSAIDVITERMGVRDTPALVTISGTQYLDEASVTDICGSAKGLVGSDRDDSVMHKLQKAHRYVTGLVAAAESRRSGEETVDPPVVFIFDEIDKAHRAIWDALMDVFHKGEYGGKGSFSGRITRLLVILVANWGASAISDTVDCGLVDDGDRNASNQAGADNLIAGMRTRGPTSATATAEIAVGASDPYDDMREHVVKDMFDAGLENHHVGRINHIIPYTAISAEDAQVGIRQHITSIGAILQAKTNIAVRIPAGHGLLGLLATQVSNTQGFRPVVIAIGNMLSALVVSASSRQFSGPVILTLEDMAAADVPKEITTKPVFVTVTANSAATGASGKLSSRTQSGTRWTVKLYL